MPKINDGTVILTRETLLRQTEEQENLLRECRLTLLRIERCSAISDAVNQLAVNMRARLEELGYGY